MSALTSSYGTNAGKVWQALNTNGELTEEKLQTMTTLRHDELYIAIGWLARENKILQETKSYRLGESNLIQTIGKYAGMIWRALDIWGEISLENLTRLSRLSEKDCLEALGWLAREGKLDASQNQEQSPVYRLA